MENQSTQSTPVVNTTEWLIAFLVMSIPLVNLIMLFIWAFSSDTNENKSNWAKAGLIWMAVIFALYLIFAIVFGVAFMSSQDF
jgi:hypothetical protein